MNTEKQNDAAKKGFTLIELLMVVAVIGILASIVIISLWQAREKSKMKSNQAEARQLVSLLNQEFADSGSYANLAVNGWVPANYSCDTLPVSGNYAAAYRTVCQSIVDRLGSRATDFNWLVGDASDTGQNFSVMIKISAAPGTGGQWFCISNRGNVYEGPFNFNAPGCYHNP